MTDFPRQYLPRIHELGTRLIDGRKPKTELALLARDLLGGFFELCELSGLDGLLPLADDAEREPALTAALATVDIDGGGPRNAKPRQLADALVAALGLTLVDEPDRTIVLDDTTRTVVVAALMAAVEHELAVPKIRDTIIATARPRIEAQYVTAFQRLSEQLDERGNRFIKQPKIPLEAVRAVQRALDDARNGLIDRVCGAAIEAAKVALARVSAGAAERIDQPVTHRATPRELAIVRVRDMRVPNTPAFIVDSLLASLTELARLAWLAAEKPVRTYSPKDTYVVGDLVEHPKFGRGTVTAISTSMPRVDIEFSDGSHTLVHVRK